MDPSLPDIYASRYGCVGCGGSGPRLGCGFKPLVTAIDLAAYWCSRAARTCLGWEGHSFFMLGEESIDPWSCVESVGLLEAFERTRRRWGAQPIHLALAALAEDLAEESANYPHRHPIHDSLCADSAPHIREAIEVLKQRAEHGPSDDSDLEWARLTPLLPDFWVRYFSPHATEARGWSEFFTKAEWLADLCKAARPDATEVMGKAIRTWALGRDW